MAKRKKLTPEERMLISLLKEANVYDPDSPSKSTKVRGEKKGPKKERPRGRKVPYKKDPLMLPAPTPPDPLLRELAEQYGIKADKYTNVRRRKEATAKLKAAAKGSSGDRVIHLGGEQQKALPAPDPGESRRRAAAAKLSRAAAGTSGNSTITMGGMTRAGSLFKGGKGALRAGILGLVLTFGPRAIRALGKGDGDDVEDQRARERLRPTSVASELRNRRVQQTMMENEALLAMTEPHLYGELNAGQKLAAGARVFGGVPDRAAVEEALIRMMTR